MGKKLDIKIFPKGIVYYDNYDKIFRKEDEKMFNNKALISKTSLIDYIEDVEYELKMISMHSDGVVDRISKSLEILFLR